MTTRHDWVPNAIRTPSASAGTKLHNVGGRPPQILTDEGNSYVLVPLDQNERRIEDSLAKEAIALIDRGDNDFVDADQFFLELAGEWIAKARVSAGLTQKQLGRKLGVPQSQIYGIERNLHQASARSRKRIAKVLGVDLRAVLP